MSRTYPRQVWVLTPSFVPKEVTVLKKYSSYASSDYGDISESGKIYPLSEMFPSKEAVIAEGYRRIQEQESKIQKMLATLEKKNRNLEKAKA